MTIHDSLERWAQTEPDRICATDGGRVLTYGKMDDWAGSVAGALEGLGLRDGDRIGVLARNCAEYVAVYYGAFKAGVVPVPLNFRLHPREWASILDDSGASAVLVQGDYVEGVDTIRNGLAAAGAFVVLDGAPRRVGSHCPTSWPPPARSRIGRRSPPRMISGRCTPAERPAGPKGR